MPLSHEWLFISLLSFLKFFKVSSPFSAGSFAWVSFPGPSVSNWIRLPKTSSSISQRNNHILSTIQDTSWCLAQIHILFSFFLCTHKCNSLSLPLPSTVWPLLYVLITMFLDSQGLWPDIRLKITMSFLLPSCLLLQPHPLSWTCGAVAILFVKDIHNCLQTLPDNSQNTLSHMSRHVIAFTLGLIQHSSCLILVTLIKPCFFQHFVFSIMFVMLVHCQPLKTLIYMEWLHDMANLIILSKVCPESSSSQCWFLPTTAQDLQPLNCKADAVQT